MMCENLSQIVIKETVCKRLRELRSNAKNTRDEIARKLNIATQTYYQYERGDRNIPYELIVNLAVYYGVNTDYIFGLKGAEQ